ncbi:MAG: carbohydrate ABC transporter permease [Treponema sp.]|jgi:putative aldouronate transport system permease protein|nr:carbohydrate ABC transporter permease [Treponema sp.]
MKRKLSSLTAEDIILDTFIALVMIMVVIVTLYPFWYVTVLAFNDANDSTMSPLFFWPRKFTLLNFTELLSEQNWSHAIFISLMRTLIGTALGVSCTSMVAFAFSFDHVIGKNLYYKLFIFTMYFSGGMIPFYVLLRSIRMLDTFWVYVIPGMINVYYMLIVINFYRTVPSSLYESARLDGAGDLRLYVSIALPLSKAPLATIALFFAVGQWNAWIDSVYYIQKASLRPLAYLMMDVINRSSRLMQMYEMASSAAADMASNAISATTTTSLQMAAMVLAVFPILAVYPFMQRHFVKGIMIGSIKE